MTIVTYGLTKVMQRIVILYGKRLFAAIVLLSVFLQLTLFVIVQRDLPLLFAHQTLGFVAPGLIAYQLVRQPPRATVRRHRHGHRHHVRRRDQRHRRRPGPGHLIRTRRANPWTNRTYRSRGHG